MTLSNLSTLSRLSLVLSFPVAVLACVADSSPPVAGGAWGEPGAVVTLDGGEDAPVTVPDEGGPSAHPILALVDRGQTMSVNPGQGVGVFTEIGLAVR